MGLMVTVRLSGSKGAVVVAVEANWTVQQLKQQIELQQGIPAAQLHLIFQGRELDDDMAILECDLGNYSVLHAVQGMRKVCGEVGSASLREAGQLRLEGREATSSSLQDDSFSGSSGPLSIPAVYRPQFFIYCKLVCNDIRPGKLRVRCHVCKRGTLTVHRDPVDWDDVLVPGRITGDCQEENCNGNTAEFHFKCSVHEGGEGESAVALDLIKSNFRNVPCITCTEIRNPVLVFPCTGGHSICLECFELYCLTRLNDRAFIHTQEHGYTLACPAGCEDSFIQEAHHFRLLGSEQYDRYQKFGTEECLLRLGGVLCPTPNCGAGILPDEGVRRVECLQGCGFVFCRSCHQAYHDGECTSSRYAGESTASGNRFSVNPTNAEDACWERQSRDTIQRTTKPCPKCGVATEKDGGCMHMMCTRCQHEWCWQCRESWNRECQGDHWFG